MLILIGYYGNQNIKLAKKKKNQKKIIFSSEAISVVKLKYSRNVDNTSFYKNFVFCCHCSWASIPMAT